MRGEQVYRRLPFGNDKKDSERTHGTPNTKRVDHCAFNRLEDLFEIESVVTETMRRRHQTMMNVG